MAVISIAKCTNCGICIPYCPTNAFIQEQDYVQVSQEKCVECNLCTDHPICPFDAIEQPDLDGSRLYRQYFSALEAPVRPAKITKKRGTGEMKTNDVTEQLDFRRVGITINLGRPELGVHMQDAEKIMIALMDTPFQFSPARPITQLMNFETGCLDEEIRNETVLSLIIEGDCSIDEFSVVLEKLKAVSKEIDTIFNLGIAARYSAEQEQKLFSIAQEHGMPASTRGKVNIGIGRK